MSLISVSGTSPLLPDSVTSLASSLMSANWPNHIVARFGGSRAALAEPAVARFAPGQQPALRGKQRTERGASFRVLRPDGAGIGERGRAALHDVGPVLCGRIAAPGRTRVASSARMRARASPRRLPRARTLCRSSRARAVRPAWCWARPDRSPGAPPRGRRRDGRTARRRKRPGRYGLPRQPLRQRR